MRSTFQPGLFRVLFSHTIQLLPTKLHKLYCYLTATFVPILRSFTPTLPTKTFQVCPDSSCPIAIRTITLNRDQPMSWLGPGSHFNSGHLDTAKNVFFDPSCRRKEANTTLRIALNLFSHNTSFVT